MSMKPSTTFNIELLGYGCKNKILKPLALYYLVKAKYNHSIIYNYTPNKLSKLTGLHWKTITRYVKKLQDHGLVEFRDGHLLFKKYQEGIKKRLATRPYTSFDGILNRIYFLILMNNKAQQTYNCVKKHGIYVETMNERTRKKALRKANIQRPSLESVQTPVVTVRGASKLFNLSNNSAFNILSNLKKKNYLNFTPLIEKVGKIKKTSLMRGNYFNKGSYLFCYLGRKIEVGSYIVACN